MNYSLDTINIESLITDEIKVDLVKLHNNLVDYQKEINRKIKNLIEKHSSRTDIENLAFFYSLAGYCLYRLYIEHVGELKDKYARTLFGKESDSNYFTSCNDMHLQKHLEGQLKNLLKKKIVMHVHRYEQVLNNEKKPTLLCLRYTRAANLKIILYDVYGDKKNLEIAKNYYDKAIDIIDLSYPKMVKEINNTHYRIHSRLNKINIKKKNQPKTII